MWKDCIVILTMFDITSFVNVYVEMCIKVNDHNHIEVSTKNKQCISKVLQNNLHLQK